MELDYVENRNERKTALKYLNGENLRNNIYR